MILDHLLYNLIPGIIAIGVGGTLGLALSLILFRPIFSHPHLQRWASLFPWRTIMVAPLFYTDYSYLPYILNLDLVEWPALMVFITIFVLAFPFTAILIQEARTPSSLRNRLLGLARTLAVGSMLVGVGEAYGLARPDDIAFRLFRAETTMHFQEASMLWLEIIGIILFVDIALGILQFRLFDRASEDSCDPEFIAEK